MKIYIQEVRSGKYFAGGQGWSSRSEEAYAFSSSIAALNFCQQMERDQPNKQFIMRFERPDALRGFMVYEGRRLEAVA